MKSKITIILLFAAIFLPAQFTAAQTKAEWTLMFYMDADNDLESPQMRDLEEMMRVGSSASINLIALSDRSPLSDPDERHYTNRAVGGLKNWTTAKLLVVEKGRLRELADWGEVNMGDPATLKKFLDTVTARFPAKRFGLVFGDHGEGWVGIVGDESVKPKADSLTTLELPPVLKDITAKTGKFELIGFDACLMANLEAAKVVAPFGKTMVASEELEPGSGWDYTPLMTAFAKNPQMDGVALGKIIVDTYRNFNLGPARADPDESVTLGIIDLEKIPAVEAAVSNLGVRNQAFLKSGGRDTYLKTARARSETDQFGRNEDGESGSHFFDLVDYAEKIKLEKPDAETVKAADAVIAAVKSAVVYKINGEEHSRASGLSIYFPPEEEDMNELYQTIAFSASGKWMPFLSDYLGISSADEEAPTVESVTISDEDIDKDDVTVVTAQVKADDLDETTFILAELKADEQIIIGSIPTEPDEKGVLQEEWDGSWFSIGDGKKELICPITDFTELDDEKDIYYVEVPAQVRFNGTQQWRDVKLNFRLDFNEEEVVGRFVNAFSFNGGQAREVEIRKGDSIRPVYISIDNNGDESLSASDDSEDILNVTKDDGITVGEMDVDAGDYLIGFVVTDFAGNTNEEFTEVTIE